MGAIFAGIADLVSVSEVSTTRGSEWATVENSLAHTENSRALPRLQLRVATTFQEPDSGRREVSRRRFILELRNFAPTISNSVA